MIDFLICLFNTNWIDEQSRTRPSIRDICAMGAGDRPFPLLRLLGGFYLSPARVGFHKFNPTCPISYYNPKIPANTGQTSSSVVANLAVSDSPAAIPFSIVIARFAAFCSAPS